MRSPTLILAALLSPWGAVAQQSYFPPLSFGSTQWLDSFPSEYSAHELQLLGEPSLLAVSKNPSAEVYRFLWLRSFNHPISVRLEAKKDGTGVLTARIAPGSAGFPYTSKGPFQSFRRSLSREQVQSFRVLVNSVGFWATPPYTFNDQTGTDGSGWIIEAAVGGQYHLVQRWSPTDSSGPGKAAVRTLGLTLAFELAQLPIPKEEIY